VQWLNKQPKNHKNSLSFLVSPLHFCIAPAPVLCWYFRLHSSGSALRPVICCCGQHIGIFVCHKPQRVSWQNWTPLNVLGRTPPHEVTRERRPVNYKRQWVCLWENAHQVLFDVFCWCEIKAWFGTPKFQAPILFNVTFLLTQLNGALCD